MAHLDTTIVIPFHRNLSQLARSLPAARLALPDAELLIAADGAVDDCGPLAAASGARVIRIAGPLGPGAARNRAVAEAQGDIVVFVDADVVAAPDSLAGLCEILRREPGVAAVFGAYDHDPAERNFMSQYKNLSHACVHESGNPEASTFWAGLGAVRTAAFRSVGGFDERFARPSVEDIDLGYRLRRAGYRIRLDPRFRGKHLKLWTTWSSIVTEIQARGIPWTQLIHRYGALTNDLNTRTELRLSLVLSYVLVFAAVAAFLVPPAALVALAALAGLIALNRDYYMWFVRKRGWWFGARVIPAHVLHHLCNGVSFAVGTLAHLSTRAGVKFPSALPHSDWVPAPPGRSTPVGSTD